MEIASPPEPLQGVDRTHRGVIYASQLLDVSRGLAAAGGADVLLEGRAVFAEVVPQPRKPRPIRRAELLGEARREFPGVP